MYEAPCGGWGCKINQDTDGPFYLAEYESDKKIRPFQETHQYALDRLWVAMYILFCVGIRSIFGDIPEVLGRIKLDVLKIWVSGGSNWLYSLIYDLGSNSSSKEKVASKTCTK